MLRNPIQVRLEKFEPWQQFQCKVSTLLTTSTELQLLYVVIDGGKICLIGP